MARIESLTAGQESLLPQFRAEWLAQGLATGPADRPGKSARETVPVPAQGIVLVRGNGGHEHRLVGTGSWTPGPARDADLGVLTVPEDGTAHVIHEEHGMLSIGPGSYRIGRQTEQWDRIRVVND